MNQTVDAVGRSLDPRRGVPGTSEEVRPLSLTTQLFLLWKMRLQVSFNRNPSQGALGAIAGTASLLLSGCAVAAAVYKGFHHPAVVHAPLLELFLFQLLGFLAAVMWIMWPIVTAGVDDSAELSRFATLPVQPSRLFLASCLAALVEPRTLVFYPMLGAAAVGFARGHHLPFTAFGFVLGTLSFALFNTAWGRVGLTSVLNVLRHRRSAEIIGGGFLITLFCCALVPPLDTSWLTASAQSGQLQLEQIHEEILEAALLLFSALPCGIWGISFLLPYRGASWAIPLFAAYGLSWAAVGFGVAFVLLLRFYQDTARSGRRADVSQNTGRPFASPSVFWVLVEREVRDLIHNPKLRLLCALPFFLTILLKLVQAREVIGAFLGVHTDVWIIVLLTTYGGVVLAANFAQNAFGYDGQGLYLLFAAPVSLRRVLVAKNLVHGAASMVLGLVLLIFYSAYVHRPTAPVALTAVCTLFFQVVMILAVGNLLSVIAPRKFHAGLQRRDRVPPLTTAGGIAAAGLALVPLRVGLYAHPGGLESLPMALALSVPLGVLIYILGLRPCLDLLDHRREGLLRAITRE